MSFEAAFLIAPLWIAVILLGGVVMALHRIANALEKVSQAGTGFRPSMGPGGQFGMQAGVKPPER